MHLIELREGKYMKESLYELLVKHIDEEDVFCEFKKEIDEIEQESKILKDALEAIAEITKEPISNYSGVIVNECFDIASGELLKLDSITPII